MSRPENLPVPIGRPRPRPAQEPRRAGAFDAHLIGQDGRRRGLRGGPPVLQAARAAYLDAEYSGPDDRRLPAGLIARKSV